MNYGFDDYENAILNELSSLKKENGGYLRVLKGYAGELGTEEAFRKFLGLMPQVLVEIESAKYTLVGCSYAQNVLINLYVSSSSYRSQDDARKGTIGVYKILKDVRNILINNNLGFEIRPLILSSERKLASSNRVVIYLAEYQIINDRII